MIGDWNAITNGQSQIRFEIGAVLYRDELVMGGWSAIGNRQSQITNRKSQIPMLYRDAGVDIDAATEAKVAIKQLARRTFNARVLKDVGAFGGFFSIKGLPRDAVLISSIDGVGTKLKIAFALNRHSTVGVDLVNHCVNDRGAWRGALVFTRLPGNGENAPESRHGSRARVGPGVPLRGLRSDRR